MCLRKDGGSIYLKIPVSHCSSVAMLNVNSLILPGICVFLSARWSLWVPKPQYQQSHWAGRERRSQHGPGVSLCPRTTAKKAVKASLERSWSHCEMRLKRCETAHRKCPVPFGPPLPVPCGSPRSSLSLSSQ